MQELVKVTFEEPSISKLSSGIRTIKDKVLFAPGFWNGRNYTKEEISKAFHNSDWSDKDVISLVADHRDDDSKGRPLTIRDWLGYISNQKLRDDGYIVGDLNFCDSELSTKLIEGEAPFGISPFVFGKFDKLDNSQKDFIFKNFAVVVEPACKECYINAYLGDDGFNDKLEELSTEERIKKRTEINEKLSQSSEEDVQNAVKGGKTKMDNEEKVEKVSEEAKEEVKPVEEVKPEEESKEEPKEEEESEEKLMEQLVKIADKLNSKRKLTPEMAKMQKLEKEVESLKGLIQKLSEEKVEEKPEEKEEESEKLSAKPRTLAVTKTVEESSGEFTGMFNRQPSSGVKDAAAKLSSLGVIN